ncbi:hypothetical protein ACFOQM_17640 [Paenibacillus sp. GCM10012307]|uniref:hypothetical protein n=1 Tax=Paenibacillus sp. GCM10012307 TaxID=3317343 RepID=UPI00360A2D0C
MVKKRASSYTKREKKRGNTIHTHAVHVNPEIKVPNASPPTVNVPAPVVNVPAPSVNIPAPVVNIPAPIVNVPPYEAQPPSAESNTILALRDALAAYVGNPLGIELFTAQGGSAQATIKRAGIVREVRPEGLVIVEPVDAIGGEYLFFPLHQIIGFHYPFYQQVN